MDIGNAHQAQESPMTSRTSRLVVALLTGALLSTAPAPASAASSGDGPVGPSTTLDILGNGWGHGNGMSQWGAEGAARQGKTHSEILDFYYPGTKAASLAGKIKVLITADSDNNLKVKAAPGLKLVDRGRHKAYRLPTDRGARLWRLKVVNGKTRVHFRNTRWHRYKPGGHKTLLGEGQFKSKGHLLTLKLPGAKRQYRGALRFSNADTVNVLSIEKYLRGVVPAEVYTSWKPAALRAQSVAARTYAAFERAANLSRHFHVYDTTRSQVYSGVAIEDPHTDAAIAATAGQVRTFAGKLAFTQFSASSGGTTSVGSQPYLKAQVDPWDTSVSPYLHWTRTVDTAKLEKAYPKIGTLQNLTITQREGPGNAEWGGWVKTIRLTGTGGDVPTIDISGDAFRALYGLRSAYFTFAQ
jgi:SpoIID/LytB domain protein